MNGIEAGILHWVQNTFAGATMDKVMNAVTLLGEGGIFWIAVSLVLIIITKTRRAGLSSGLALLMGLIVVNVVIKNAVGRMRPYDFDPTLRREALQAVMDGLSDYSFPSGHSLACFEAATAIFIRYKKWGIGAYVIAVAVALSRIYLCVHYVSDVLAGAVLGMGIAVLASYIVDKGYAYYYKKFAKKA